MMAITVPVTGDQMSATTFGGPVATEVNRMTPLVVAPTTWTTFAYQNGWTSFGGAYAPMRYRKIGDIVYIQGVAKGGSPPPSPGQMAIAILPAAYRPPTNVINTVLFGGSDSWGGMGRMDVWSTGEVLVIASAAMPGAATMVAASFAYSTI